MTLDYTRCHIPYHFPIKCKMLAQCCFIGGAASQTVRPAALCRKSIDAKIVFSYLCRRKPTMYKIVILFCTSAVAQKSIRAAVTDFYAVRERRPLFGYRLECSGVSAVYHSVVSRLIFVYVLLRYGIPVAYLPAVERV